MRGLFSQLGGKTLGEGDTAKDLNFNPLPEPHKVFGDFAPFACCVRQFSCRFGPSGFPLTGVGGFVRSYGPMHGIVLDIVTLQSAGLHSFADLEQTLDHTKFRTWRPTAVQIDDKSLLWVPYGHISLLSTSEEFGRFMTIPWFSSSLAVQSSEELWQFVSSTNISFGNKSSDRRPWKWLLPSLRAFSEGLFK